MSHSLNSNISGPFTQGKTSISVAKREELGGIILEYAQKLKSNANFASGVLNVAIVN